MRGSSFEQGFTSSALVSLWATANSKEISGRMQMPSAGRFSKLCQDVSSQLLLVQKRAETKTLSMLITSVCFLCVVGNSMFSAEELFMIRVQGCSVSERNSLGHRNQLKIRHKCSMFPKVNESQSRDISSF